MIVLQLLSALLMVICAGAIKIAFYDDPPKTWTAGSIAVLAMLMAITGLSLYTLLHTTAVAK